MKTANETMTAADALKHQMDAADIVIARCKKMISDLDDRLRSQSHDICKYMNSLSGSSIACSAGNIVAFAAQMQAAASELQAAQDWKRDAAARLEWING